MYRRPGLSPGRLLLNEHDIVYRIGRRPILIHHEAGGYELGYGEPVTRAWADARFRSVIQSLSIVRRAYLPGWLSPMSWWRWTGVRLGGRRTWERYRAA